MAVTKVVTKNSTIDGKPIEWYVLAVTGYVGGDFQTLELKLTKTEAMLAGLLLNSTEELSVHSGGKGEDVQVNRNKA